ncbi:MAG: hypothetical protein ACE15F_10010 [bacterium]
MRVLSWFTGRFFVPVGCWFCFVFTHVSPGWTEITGNPLFSDGFEVNDPSSLAWEEQSGNLPAAGPPAPITGD